MGHSCRVHKTCYVCGQTKHNLEFHSNASGRIDIKPYCKYCKTIYEGLQKGILSSEMYLGKNYDWSKLDEETFGYIVLAQAKPSNRALLLSKKEAIEWIKQGGAFVTSNHTLEMIFPGSQYNKKLREYVFNRDNNTCAYCDEPGDTIDHVIPQSLGGLDTMLNWVCACYDCNQIKADIHPTKFFQLLRSGKLNLEKEKIRLRKSRQEKMDKIDAKKLKDNIENKSRKSKAKITKKIVSSKVNTPTKNIPKTKGVNKKQKDNIVSSKVNASIQDAPKTKGTKNNQKKNIEIPIKVKHDTPKKQIKKCNMCESDKQLNQFAPSHTHCRKCHPFEKAFQRGFISSISLSSLNVDVSILSNGNIMVADKDGYLVNNVPMENARLAVKHHYASIESPNKIRLLFTRNEMILLGFKNQVLKAI